MERSKTIGVIAAVVLVFVGAVALSIFVRSGEAQHLTPTNGQLEIPVGDINDGRAHHFTATADDGTEVTFFTLKSKDGVIRAAIDACDICYTAGLGYTQDGNFMVCENCGQRFAADKINVLKGGCNPAPLRRNIEGDNLVIAMEDINTNSWYAEYRQ